MSPRGIVVPLLLALTACSNDPGAGPVEIKWDRDNCNRCRMVISDPHFAAQIRHFPEGKRSIVETFDDIGCATLWLDEQRWKDDPTVEIWVADFRTGDWIDARTATYVAQNTTPMEYGLGAQPTPGGMSFEQAKAHVYDVEQRFNRHGIQLLDRLKEQANERENAQ
jgi:nitrous oxide reductase accessory protein NosL